MEKCDCYRTIKKYSHNLFHMPYYTEVGICNGTKEQEECSCEGNRLNCNFYSYVREEAKKSITIQDAINHFKYGISHDIFEEPVTTYAEMAIEALKKMKLE